MKTASRKKLAQGILFLAAFLFTAIVLFYSVTSYLGRREWAAAKNSLEARGEKLSIVELVPPPLADQLNFFAAPVFAELADYELVGNAGVTSLQPRVPKEKQKLTVVKTSLGTPFQKVKRSPTYAMTDLGAAAAYYQAEGKVTAGHRPAAEVVLEALEPARPVVEEVALSAQRPGARFPIRYEEGINAAFPHLEHMLTLARYLSLRATAEMELGRGTDAARDILLILRLADSLKGEPTLISLLVRFNALSIAHKALWEGVARGAWDDARLAMFEERLRGYDLFPEMADALRGERGQILYLLESALQKAELGNLLSAMNLMTGDGTNARRDSIGALLITTLYPKGWAYSDLALIATLHQRWIHALGDRGEGLRPADFEFLENEIMQWSFPTKIKHIFSAKALPSVVGIVNKGVSVQAGIDEARTALTLERYRLAYGNFPDSLEALVPQFLPAVPLDRMTSKPHNYRRISSDDFVLWSIGWDAVDDNGTPVDRKTKKGDWVWTRQPGN